MTKFEVWTEGYKGHGATIPSFLGAFDADTFEAACQIADPKGAVIAYEGPCHPTAEAAWAAYDAHWTDVGGIYAPDKTDRRRPATMREDPVATTAKSAPSWDTVLAAYEAAMSRPHK
jgi:hypothetical protein